MAGAAIHGVWSGPQKRGKKQTYEFLGLFVEKCAEISENAAFSPQSCLVFSDFVVDCTYSKMINLIWLEVYNWKKCNVEIAALFFGQDDALFLIYKINIVERISEKYVGRGTVQ